MIQYLQVHALSNVVSFKLPQPHRSAQINVPSFVRHINQLLKTPSNHDSQLEESYQSKLRNDPYLRCFGCIPMTNSTQTTTNNNSNNNKNNANTKNTNRFINYAPSLEKFDARFNCWAREYQYLIPIEILSRRRQSQTTSTKELIEQLNSLAKQFEGTHNFHNFFGVLADPGAAEGSGASRVRRENNRGEENRNSSSREVDLDKEEGEDYDEDREYGEEEEMDEEGEEEGEGRGYSNKEKRGDIIKRGENFRYLIVYTDRCI